MEVLGLVARRRATLWTEWGPWLALVGVAIPLGVLLGQLSWWWADGSAVYAFLYVNHWTWAYVESPGARRDLLDISTRVCLNDLALIGWSWSSGFALGSLSRRTLRVTSALFCLAVFVGFASSSGATARANPFNAAVFSLPFYRVLYPWLVLTALVLLPAAWGIRRSRRAASLSLMPTLLGLVVSAMLTASAARTLELSTIARWHLMRLRSGARWFRRRGQWCSTPASPSAVAGLAGCVHLRERLLAALAWPVGLGVTAMRRSQPFLFSALVVMSANIAAQQPGPSVMLGAIGVPACQASGDADYGLAANKAVRRTSCRYPSVHSRQPRRMTSTIQTRRVSIRSARGPT